MDAIYKHKSLQVELIRNNYFTIIIIIIVHRGNNNNNNIHTIYKHI